MKRYPIRCICLLLCVLLLPHRAYAQQSFDAQKAVASASSALSSFGGKSGTLLSDGEKFPAGTSVCDWVAIALALSGSEEDYTSYLDSLREYVENAYALNGTLDRVKSTTCHRICLTVLALGGDPTHFGNKTDGTPIDLIADGTYDFPGDSIGAQGLNGWIYALIALDAAHIDPPADARFSREDMIAQILDAQEADGGFGFISGTSDVDITAMALQALAPYRDMCADAIEAALGYLGDSMDGQCFYTAYSEASAESTAQVVMALCALGIDPQSDSRFLRGDHSLLTALDSFRLSDGTYAHSHGEEEGNYLASAQVLLALTALWKLRSADGWIFDFTNPFIPNQKSTNSLPIFVAAGAALLAVGIVIAEKRRKYAKHHR